jgi:hypothetical protein
VDSAVGWAEMGVATAAGVGVAAAGAAIVTGVSAACASALTSLTSLPHSVAG